MTEVQVGTLAKKSTINQVAALAGVSRATASRVLGGYGFSSETARDAVLAAAKELNYSHNDLARSMIKGNTLTIGFIMADIRDPFFSSMTFAVQRACSALGYTLLLGNTSEDLDKEREILKNFRAKRVDGIIASPVSSFAAEHFQAVVNSGTPLVLFDREIANLSVDTVSIDGDIASYEATMKLHQMGHSRITVITSGRPDPGSTDLAGLSSCVQRVQGYLRAMKDLDLPPFEGLVPEQYFASIPPVERAIQMLQQKDPVTAFVASDATVSLELLKAARILNLSVPEDFSILGFDDLPWMEYASPRISAIRQPIADMGEKAVALLMDRIAGSAKPPVKYRPPTLTIMRDSVRSLQNR